VAAVAQLERDLIRERVAAGIRVARQNGKRLGRPRVTVSTDEILRLRAEGQSSRKIAAALGIGEGTVRDRLKSQARKTLLSAARNRPVFYRSALAFPPRINLQILAHCAHARGIEALGVVRISASDEAAFTVGAELLIDGGMSL